MRIAVSSAHGTGKSTLIEELARVMPDLRVEEESYVQLAATGAAFADRPDAADYAVLCEHACELVVRSLDHVLFDRTPADYLAYFIAVGGDVAGTDLVERTRRALAHIDHIVFVPIEVPDRVNSDGELPRLRRRVDRILRAMWIDDAWGFGARVIDVCGTVPRRTQQVLAHAAPDLDQRVDAM